MQDIDILVNGRPVRQLTHEGKLFVVAKPGTEYEIRVKNNDARRIMAVASIDGLSVLDGKSAKTEGPGYVIEGYNSYTIKGWRTSNNEVRAFEFSKKKKSYAEKSESGDSQDCGVIGVIIHAEKEKKPKVVIQKEYINVPYPIYPSPPYRPHRPRPYWPYDYDYPYSPWRRWNEVTWTSATLGSASGGDNTSSAGNLMQSQNGNTGMLRSMNMMSSANNASYATSSSPAEFDLGTKFSDKEIADQVTSTKFKASHIIQKIEIFYASEDQLRKMGVNVDKESKVAFPEAFKGNGYCKVPRQ